MQLRKRTCRECGATQTYDEVEKKKKRCPCGGLYVFATGTHVSDEKRHEMFIDRLKKREEQKHEKMKRLKARVEFEERGGKPRRRERTPRRFEETGFLRRMKDDMNKREKRRQEARGFDETKHQTLSNALRTVKSDLRRCESRIHAAASKSASRRKHSRSRVYDDDDDDAASSRRIQRLQEQLQAASLMAQELQHEVSSPTRRRKSPRRPPLGGRNRRRRPISRKSASSSRRSNRKVVRRGGK